MNLNDQVIVNDWAVDTFVALYEKGWQAFTDGCPRRSNPYRYMDSHPWFRGYDDAAWDSANNATIASTEDEGASDFRPAVGSRWRHRNGASYVVLHIANEPSDDRYPLTVVYQGPNGRVWTRRADDWLRSMTAEVSA